MEENDHGEVVAIRGYLKFYRHLVAKGRIAEARKINEIKNEEVVHRKELNEIRKRWRAMK